MRRRTFLQTSAASVLTASLSRPLWAFPKGNPYMKSMGLQLWTVRNQLADDQEATIKAVADAGYRQVELMTTLDAAKIVPVAKFHGLDVTSAFFDWRVVAAPNEDDVPSFQKVLEVAQKQDLKYLIFGYVGKGHREKADQYKTMAERANKAGEQCKAAGIQLCYHNHSFEFETLDGGKNGYEIFIEEFDHDLLKFELDVFWVAVGGWDPVTTMRKLSGRVAQLHLKDVLEGTGTIYDERKVPEEAFKEVGNGTIDMPAVLKAAEETNVAQCHVEQDASPDPLESIRQSMKYLRNV